MSLGKGAGAHPLNLSKLGIEMEESAIPVLKFSKKNKKYPKGSEKAKAPKFRVKINHTKQH